MFAVRNIWKTKGCSDGSLHSVRRMRVIFLPATVNVEYNTVSVYPRVERQCAHSILWLCYAAGQAPVLFFILVSICVTKPKTSRPPLSSATVRRPVAATWPHHHQPAMLRQVINKTIRALRIVPRPVLEVVRLAARLGTCPFTLKSDLKKKKHGGQVAAMITPAILRHLPKQTALGMWSPTGYSLAACLRHFYHTQDASRAVARQAVAGPMAHVPALQSLLRLLQYLHPGAGTSMCSARIPTPGLPIAGSACTLSASASCQVHAPTACAIPAPSISTGSYILWVPPASTGSTTRPCRNAAVTSSPSRGTSSASAPAAPPVTCNDIHYLSCPCGSDRYNL